MIEKKEVDNEPLVSCAEFIKSLDTLYGIAQLKLPHPMYGDIIGLYSHRRHSSKKPKFCLWNIYVLGNCISFTFYRKKKCDIYWCFDIQDQVEKERFYKFLIYYDQLEKVHDIITNTLLESL